MSDDLATWLLAAIDEDERLASSARGNTEGEWALRAQDAPVVLYDASGKRKLGEMRFIAAWDPARVLAECEAKRQIIALHPVAAFPDLESIYDDAGVFQTQRPTGGTVYSCPVCDDYYDGGTEYHSQPGCPTLRALALPYADRPDYREEWRP